MAYKRMVFFRSGGVAALEDFCPRCRGAAVARLVEDGTLCAAATVRRSAGAGHSGRSAGPRLRSAPIRKRCDEEPDEARRLSGGGPACRRERHAYHL